MCRALFILFMIVAGIGAGGCAMLPEQEDAAPRYTSPSELYDRALDSYQKGQYARARDLFHEYTGQFPDSRIFRVALYYLAHCYQMLSQDKEALALYNRIVADHGDEDFWGQQALARIRQINESK
jgi:TolA-binding protein